MKKFLYCLCLNTLLIVACNPKEQTAPEAIKVDFTSTAAPSFEVLNIVPLQTTSEAFVGNLYQVLQHKKGEYIVSDEQKILIYDNVGKIKTIINTQGRSEKEYLECGAVDIDHDTLWVFDTGVGKMMKFGINGQYISGKQLGYVGFPFVLDDERIIFHAQGMIAAENHSLMIMDKTGELIKRSTPNHVDCPTGYHTQHRLTRKTDGNIHYVPNLENALYRINKEGDAELLYTFDFGKHTLSQEEITAVKLQNQSMFSYTKENDKILFFNCLDSPVWIGTSFCMGKEAYSWYYDKRSREQFLLKKEREKPSLLTYPIVCLDGNNFVFSVPAAEYLQYFNSLKNLKIREEDNPVLITIQLK